MPFYMMFCFLFCRMTTTCGLPPSVSVHALKNGELKCPMKFLRTGVPGQICIVTNGTTTTWSCKPMKTSTDASQTKPVMVISDWKRSKNSSLRLQLLCCNRDEKFENHGTSIPYRRCGGTVSILVSVGLSLSVFWGQGYQFLYQILLLTIN